MACDMMMPDSYGFKLKRHKNKKQTDKNAIK